MRAGFMPLPHLFLRHYRKLGLSHLQAMFVLQLMEIAWDLGDPPASIGKLADRLAVDRRTVQSCSKAVHDLGLVEIYDQWDEGGAQVENGYDLSPLFHRLAELAPEPRPAGTLRMRRNRYADPADVFVDEMASGSDAIRPGRSSDRPSPRSTAHPLPGSADRGRPDLAIAAPMRAGSGLKAEPKNPFKKREQPTKNHRQPVARAGESRCEDGEVRVGGVGRSLRRSIDLSETDVQSSRLLLDRCGVSKHVADASAATLHPAEVWSLWAYARAARLGPAWIAKQIYDFAERRPRPPDLSQRYDEVGRLLSAIDLGLAERVLAIVDMRCQRDANGRELDFVDVADGPCRRAAEALWAMMAEQRGGQLQLPGLPGPESATEPDDGPPAQTELNRLWETVRTYLTRRVAQDAYQTWLAPLVLLDLGAEEAIVAAPNVFVRDEVAVRFLPDLSAAIEAAIEHPVTVDIVIARPVAA